MTRGSLIILFGAVSVAAIAPFVAPSVAQAADLRIIDSSGLVRAVRVVSQPATVKITIEGVSSPHGECVAANVDGLAAEKREPVSPQGVCIFKELPTGSWQVTIPVKARWRVQIN